MKLAIIGASGGTGKILVRKALDAGHEVRALVRNPSKLAISHPGLTPVTGNVLDRAKVEEAVRGADAVVSALGPVRGDPPGLMRPAATNIVNAMKTTGAKRLVYMTGAGVVQPEDPKSLVPMIMLPIMKLLAKNVLEDSAAGVDAVKNSSLDWIVVRAPRLGDVPPKKQYRTGYIKPKFDAMSREDVADFVLKQVTSNEYLRKLPIVSY